jgi:SAM-dependent methyltransferase
MSEPLARTEVENVSADAFAQKLFTNVLACMETFSLYLGDKLGWFTELTAGPLTGAELAQRTNTVERYAVEWLEMQAVYGNLVVVDDGNVHRSARRFTLPPGPAEVMTDLHSLAYLGAFPEFIAAVGAQLDNLASAYRNGGGVSWAQFGDGMRSAQAALNRPLFEGQLGPALAGVESVHTVLSKDGARVADIGCGAGWSTIALAEAYPAATVIGFDVDEPSIELARNNAAASGVVNRVSFELAGGETLPNFGWFDAAFAFECVHDMPRPVDVLAGIRQAVRPDGLVVIVDEAVADTFTAPGDELERTMYGYSTLVCLPDGLSSTPSVGTGTVMRRSILTDYATQAGFGGVDVLPIEDFGFFRFYSLR